MSHKLTVIFFILFCPILLFSAIVPPKKSQVIGGLEFVWIPAGTFLMGSRDSDPDARESEKPQHQVTLKGFWISKYEVTQKVYQDVIGSNPSSFEGENNPVESVSWEDAVNFCRKFNTRFGTRTRLPTEAEWEYACRAGSTNIYYWGKKWDQEMSWNIYTASNRTHPVGLKPPNAWGLYDMVGNVWEWCSDWYRTDFYTDSPSISPECTDSDCKWKVLRGGSFYYYIYDIDLLRSAFRGYEDPTYNGLVGFRPVKSE